MEGIMYAKSIVRGFRFNHTATVDVLQFHSQFFFVK